MKKILPFLILIILCAGNLLHAQDTLPKFLLKNVGNNRIVIGWVNTYTNIKQLSIQRSFDSLTGFKTIITVPDPLARENGFVDSKATNDHMFYRLYILLDQGIYLFSEAKKPYLDTARKTIAINAASNINMDNVDPAITDSMRKANPFYVKMDSLIGIVPGIVPNGVTPKNVQTGFTPSIYVFTNKDGFVRVSLPDDEKPKKYSIKFFDSDGTFLFELKEIKEKDFKVDKANFYHAGWFKFELYEDDKLLEKHKFYLEKDF